MSGTYHGDVREEAPSGSGDRDAGAALRSGEGRQRGGPELCVLPETL